MRFMPVLLHLHRHGRKQGRSPKLPAASSLITFTTGIRLNPTPRFRPFRWSNNAFPSFSPSAAREILRSLLTDSFRPLFTCLLPAVVFRRPNFCIRAETDEKGQGIISPALLLLSD